MVVSLKIGLQIILVLYQLCMKYILAQEFCWILSQDVDLDFFKNIEDGEIFGELDSNKKTQCSLDLPRHPATVANEGL